MAILAGGQEHTVKEEALGILASLSPAGKSRCLAYASWLLPADSLPQRAVLEAWEAEALTAFRHPENGDWGAAHGIAYVDRLETAGAVEAAKRLLPDLVESVSSMVWLSQASLEGIFRRLARLERPDLQARLESLLLNLLSRDPFPASPPQVELLTTLLNERARNPEPAVMSADLFRRVTAILEEGAGKPSATETDPASSRQAGDYQEAELLSVAFAAVGDARFHDSLRRLVSSRMAGTPAPETVRAWRSLEDFFAMLDSRQALPQVELSFRPEGDRKGVLSWSFQGVQPPPAVEKALVLDQQPILPVWPSATAPVAAALAGQFDALILITEDGPPNPERLAARIEKMPVQGSMALTDLPRTGSIRLQLIQLGKPQLIGTAGPISCNTLPILLDTGGLGKEPDSAVHPPGWRLLCAPGDLANEAWCWQVSGLDVQPAWPEGLALLMLDEAGNVCAAADLHEAQSQALSGWSEKLKAKAGAAAGTLTVSRAQFSAGSGRSGGEGEWDVPIVMTGSPRQLALAVSTRAAAPRPYSGSHAPPSRLMVQACPATAPRIPPVGRMEVLRSWSLPSAGSMERNSVSGNPAVNSSLTRAAWLGDGKLVFFDFENENTAPRTLAWSVPQNGLIQSMFWTDSRFHIQVDISDSAGSGPNGKWSVLYSIDPDQIGEAQDGDTLAFGQLVRITGLDFQGLTGVRLVQGDSGLYGILNAEGLVLMLDPSAAAGRNGQRLDTPEYALSPTSAVLRGGKETEWQVLDWTDGTLRLSTGIGNSKPQAEKALPRGGANASKMTQTPEGMLADLSLERPGYWFSPLKLVVVWPGARARALGLALSPDGGAASLVLLRKVPIPGSPARQEP